MKFYKIITASTAILFLFLASVVMMGFLQANLQDTTLILGADLYPRWVGTQAILKSESPYSLATRQQIWLEIYGSANKPEGNPFGFYYPPGITTLLMPFVLSGIQTKTAAYLWCAFLFTILSIELFFWTTKFRYNSKRFIILPALLISGWLFRPAFSNYILGQPALLCVSAAVAAWFLFEYDRPVLAGIFSALALVKPTLTIIPVGILLVKNRSRPTGIYVLIASLLLLYLPPTLLIGNWLPDFLRDISNYSLENRVAWSAIDTLTIPGILWISTAILLMTLGIFLNKPFLTFGAAFAINTAITPHSADYDLVAFIPLLAYLGNHWISADKNRGVLTILFFILVWFPWISLVYTINIFETNAIESWYRFIWMSYPLIILLLGLLNPLSIMNKGFSICRLSSHE